MTHNLPEEVKKQEQKIRLALGFDAGYMGNEFWDWDLDHLPPFEGFLSGDLISALLAVDKQAYERGLHETAIKMDKELVEWLEGNTESQGIIEVIKKQARQEGMDNLLRELGIDKQKGQTKITHL